MLKSWAYIFPYLVPIVLAITCLTLLKNWNKSPIKIKYLAYFLFWNLFIEIMARITSYYGHNNLFLLHLYTLMEFLLLSIFYKKIHKPEWRNSSYFSIFIFCISILIILNSIILQPLSGFNSYAKTLVQFIIIVYAFSYFFYLSHVEIKRSVEQNSLRIINSSILIYYSSTLFIFMFSNYFFVRGIRMLPEFWIFNAILNLIFHFFILIAIWKIFKIKKSSY